MADGGQGQSSAVFSTEFEVTNGSISGKDLSFTFSDCAYTAKVVGGGEKWRKEGACNIPLPSLPFLNALIFKPQR